ncbi:hypothetical protein L9F63_008208, partial [Diploptera punctata]
KPKYCMCLFPGRVENLRLQSFILVSLPPHQYFRLTCLLKPILMKEGYLLRMSAVDVEDVVLV